jgi:hypothetical protein
MLWVGTVLLWTAVLVHESLRPRWPNSGGELGLALFVLLTSGVVHSFVQKREHAFVLSLFLGSAAVAVIVIVGPLLIALVGWLLV